MDTAQIACLLRDVGSFSGVYASDLLPRTIVKPACIIVNVDPHTQSGSHWLAIRLEPGSSNIYYFDSYGLPPLVPAISRFIRHNCTVHHYNTVCLQSLTDTVCGHYCCLFALYTDRGLTPAKFVMLFDPDIADQHVRRYFASEFDRYATYRVADSAVVRKVRYATHLRENSARGPPVINGACVIMTPLTRQLLVPSHPRNQYMTVGNGA